MLGSRPTGYDADYNAYVDADGNIERSHLPVCKVTTDFYFIFMNSHLKRIKKAVAEAALRAEEINLQNQMPSTFLNSEMKPPPKKNLSPITINIQAFEEITEVAVHVHVDPTIEISGGKLSFLKRQALFIMATFSAFGLAEAFTLFLQGYYPDTYDALYEENIEGGLAAFIAIALAFSYITDVISFKIAHGSFKDNEFSLIQNVFGRTAATAVATTSYYGWWLGGDLDYDNLHELLVFSTVGASLLEGIVNTMLAAINWVMPDKREMKTLAANWGVPDTQKIKTFFSGGIGFWCNKKVEKPSVNRDEEKFSINFNP